ncbi:MAG: cell division ATP-binding protein FtsE [Desulfarculus sp.]|nr:cell division ATP-binding protein FtsE [Desulfarculus sp.]
MGAMILLSRVAKRYPGRQAPALERVDLHVPPGQFVYLTGPSGAGKTTLLRLLFAAEAPSSGVVKVGGSDLGRLKQSQIPLLRRKIGVIFQDFKLIQGRSVFENVALALRVAGINGRQLPGRVEEVLRRVGLWEQARTLAGDLSGGEQQRAAVARALVGRPPLLLADEPTGNLDPDSAREVMRLILEAHGRGATVLVATHDPALLGLVQGARVVRLRAGRLEEGA